MSGHQRGHSENESVVMDEEDMLLEVMEAREKAEEASDDPDKVQRLREENNERIEAVVQNLEHAFGEGDLDGAAKAVSKLRYWVGVEDRLRTGSSMH
jgi:DnaJ-domain-containing protein 1